MINEELKGLSSKEQDEVLKQLLNRFKRLRRAKWKR
nr:MAG TPA: hypothetical protein [Caudoviricetes sp.]